MPSLQNRVVHLDSARYHGGLRTRPVTLLVLHCTAGGSAQSSIRWLNRPGATGVASYHYVIDRDGTIYRMLPTDKVAYHAGDSWFPAEPTKMRQEKTVNGFSIGIAWANRNDGERLTEKQIESAEWLCRLFMQRYKIPPSRVVGHNEVSPRRKTDPAPAVSMAHWRARLSG